MDMCKYVISLGHIQSWGYEGARGGGNFSLPSPPLPPLPPISPLPDLEKIEKKNKY